MSPASDAAKRNRQRRSSARSNSGSCLAESGVVSCATAILVSESKGVNALSLPFSLSLLLSPTSSIVPSTKIHTHTQPRTTQRRADKSALLVAGTRWSTQGNARANVRRSIGRRLYRMQTSRRVMCRPDTRIE